MKKNNLKYIILIFIVMFSSSLYAQTKINNIEIFKSLAEAIGECGDAIKKLTDGIKYAVVNSAEGYDAILARSTYTDLVELYVATTDLMISQGSGETIVYSLDSYTSRPSKENWERVVMRLDFTLNKVDELIKKLKKEKSDLVLDVSYENLLKTLNSRVFLIQTLKSISAPKTRQEIKAIHEASINYKKLRDELIAANKELYIYINKHNPKFIEYNVPIHVPYLPGDEDRIE